MSRVFRGTHHPSRVDLHRVGGHPAVRPGRSGLRPTSVGVVRPHKTTEPAGDAIQQSSVVPPATRRSNRTILTEMPRHDKSRVGGSDRPARHRHRVSRRVARPLAGSGASRRSSTSRRSRHRLDTLARRLGVAATSLADAVRSFLAHGCSGPDRMAPRGRPGTGPARPQDEGDSRVGRPAAAARMGAADAASPRQHATRPARADPGLGHSRRLPPVRRQPGPAGDSSTPAPRPSPAATRPATPRRTRSSPPWPPTSRVRSRSVRWSSVTSSTAPSGSSATTRRPPSARRCSCPRSPWCCRW